MTRNTTAAFCSFLALIASDAFGTIIIDNFTTFQAGVELTAPAGIGMTASGTQIGGGIIGMERDIEVYLQAGPNGNRIRVLVASYNHSQDGGVTGTSMAVWDGPDGNGSVIDYTGLGGVDLTNGGLDDAIELLVGSADLNTTIIFDVYSDAGNASRFSLNLPGGVLANDTFVLPYAGFTTILGAGADFTNVGAITMKVDGLAVASLDVLVSLVQTTRVLNASKTDAHIVDVNMDGNVDVGDTIGYTVTITNPDDDGNQSALNVVFTDTPGVNSTLVVGSVTTTQGSVVIGNTGGDTSVEVNVGAIADGGSVTITFSVTVTGIPEVCNQGFVYDTQPTDDPGTVATDDPTCTTIAYCGDGIVNDPTEECDDANADNTDACLNTCQNAECGDGFTWVGMEECDDANMDNTDACLNTCVDAECGDGFTWVGMEECDDANADNTDACLNTCVDAECGDGFVWAGMEECDDANASNTDACLNTCVDAECGDGFEWAGMEECDDGNASNTDACLNTCLDAECGDGFVQAGVEECDDANASNTDACLNTCVNAECGDGFVQAGVEECDDANASNTDACLNTCVDAECGDGFEWAGMEECDDGNASNTDACLNTCLDAECGDGFVQAGVEECDDGNMVNTDACPNTCENAECGDGFVQAGVEACDDGNASNTDACLNSCEPAECGDGFVQAGVEACDDGNASNTDACLNTCVSASCGDGFVQVGVEQCDDGDNDNGDGCSSTCTFEGACCLPSGACIVVSSASCLSQGGDPSASGTVCAPARACCDGLGGCENMEPTCCVLDGGTPFPGPCAGADADMNGSDDACDGGENPTVPTISAWGMFVLSLLLVTGLVLRRDRRAAAA